MENRKIRAWNPEKERWATIGEIEKILVNPIIVGDKGYFSLDYKHRKSEDLSIDLPLKLLLPTGLLDKNGKEIYEGDIVKSAMIYHGNPGTEFLSKIVYNSKIGAYQISYLNMNDAFVTDNIGFKYQLEIIGNIYENPDLLK